MNSKLTRKFILSVSSLALTAICLSSTTYAWFAKNANAWTEDYEIKLHTDEGLKISVDGIHWYDSISRDQLSNAIALYRYNTINSNAKITYEELTPTIVANYSTTSLAPVSPDDDFDFYGFDPNKEYIPSNGLYELDNLTEAKVLGNYVCFDLYFQAIPSSNDAKSKYNLVFADEALAEGFGVSKIEAENSTITLANQLNIPESKDIRFNPETIGLYKSGETITINPANAMRMAVTGTKDPIIYEINNDGYGSYALKDIPDGAIDDSIKDLYDASKNPMYTYFNNTHNQGNLDIPYYAEKYLKTEKDFDGLKNLGEFVRDSEGNYNDVKITVYIWLEGYDADYLEGVNTESVHFFLNFTKVEG